VNVWFDKIRNTGRYIDDKVNLLSSQIEEMKKNDNIKARNVEEMDGGICYLYAVVSETNKNVKNLGEGFKNREIKFENLKEEWKQSLKVLNRLL
jgi:hypothetical protein